jgi:signal transduction histidine kinase
LIARALPGTIPSGVALCAYRVVQEALGNVAKHAEAQHAVISISSRDNVLCVVSVRRTPSSSVCGE